MSRRDRNRVSVTAVEHRRGLGAVRWIEWQNVVCRASGQFWILDWQAATSSLPFNPKSKIRNPK
jgi:hypothetical protein